MNARTPEEELLDCVMLGGAAPKSAALRLDYLRDMTEADVAALEGAHGRALPALYAAQAPSAQMRYRHHLLAKSLARGARVIEASAETGYASETIASLMKSPAFAELLTYYSEQNEVKHLELAERRAQVGVQALEELAERLDDPEKRSNIPTQELRKIAEGMLGRLGGTQATGGAAGIQGGLNGLTLSVQFVSPEPSRVVPPVTLDLEAREAS